MQPYYETFAARGPSPPPLHSPFPPHTSTVARRHKTHQAQDAARMLKPPDVKPLTTTLTPLPPFTSQPPSPLSRYRRLRTGRDSQQGSPGGSRVDLLPFLEGHGHLAVDEAVESTTHGELLSLYGRGLKLPLLEGHRKHALHHELEAATRKAEKFAMKSALGRFTKRQLSMAWEQWQYVAAEMRALRDEEDRAKAAMRRAVLGMIHRKLRMGGIKEQKSTASRTTFPPPEGGRKGCGTPMQRILPNSGRVLHTTPNDPIQ
jgi:hypothetical protein